MGLAHISAAHPSCWAPCHDVTHAGNDELGWLPASAAAAAPGCWLLGPRGWGISAAGAPHTPCEHHLTSSRRILSRPKALSAHSTPAEQQPPVCTPAVLTKVAVSVWLCSPATGSASATTWVLCCLQSVAGLLDAQACAAEGLQPRLAAEAGLQALRVCAGQLHAFEQLWARFQLGQRLQTLRQPGVPSHAVKHSALPAIAPQGSTSGPGSPVSSRAMCARLAGSRHLNSAHEGTDS